VAYLLRFQLVPANTYYLRNRSRVIGGFKTVWVLNIGPPRNH